MMNVYKKSWPLPHLVFFAMMATVSLTAEDRMFVYDANLLVANVDERIIQINVLRGVPLGSKVHKVIYACTNGYFSFTERFCDWNPNFNLGYDIVAAFWYDIDFRGGNGGFLATVHDSTATDDVSVKLFNQTKLYLQRYANVTNFFPNTVVLGTWYKGTPYPYYNYLGKTENVYFQINIATDGRTTHVSFVYGDDGMLWSQYWLKPRVGYTIQNGSARESYQQILNADGHPSANRFHDVVGNTNSKGRWSWRLANNLDNNAAKCYDWYARQPNESTLNTIRKHGSSDCPCLYKQIIFDRRFKPSSSGSNTVCYEQMATWSIGTSVSFHTACCYDRRSLFLINNIDPDIGVATQKHLSLSYSRDLIRFSGYYRSISRSQAVADDSKAFEYCCQKSSLCNLYSEKRPVPTCSLYTPPTMAFTFGDPHIQTLDGHTYTFNGIGDYILFSVKNSTEFIIHSRMSKAQFLRNSSLTESRATVFSAFAMKTDQGALVELYLNVTTGTVQILVNKKNYSTSFFATTQTFNNTEINWSAGNKTQLSVTYDSGVGAVIGVFSSHLTIRVTTSTSYVNNTVGLLGVNNNDINDDFTRPNGTTIPIGSTQKKIYYEFGKLWNVADNATLFSFFDVDYDPSFVPKFYDNVDAIFTNNAGLTQQAVNLCGPTNFQCLFDYALTEDSQAVTESQSALKDFESEKRQLATFPPTIQGPSTFNVTLNTTVTFKILASNTMSSTLEYKIEANGTEPIVDSKSGNVTWFINSTDFRLKYVVTDSNNNSASLSPTVTMCNCRNGGVCNPSVANTLFDSTNNLLNYGECKCQSGFTGAFCQTPVSYCLQKPCFEGVSCTNVTSQSADCGSCPTGYIGDGRKCYDFDECMNKTDGCDQICTNLLGGYNCSCYTGYYLKNKTHCIDSDECTSNTHNCSSMASCTNTPGLFNCTCKSGLTGNGTYCQDIDECKANKTDCHGNAKCSNTIGSYLCSCIPGFAGDGKISCANDSNCASFGGCHANAACINDKGYYSCRCNNGFTGNGTICEDYNECSTINYCDVNAICLNTVASFTCSCKEGYTGNGKVCTKTKNEYRVLAIAIPIAVLCSLFLLLFLILAKKRRIKEKRQNFYHFIDVVINPKMRAEEVSSVKFMSGTEGKQFVRIHPDFFYSPGEG